MRIQPDTGSRHDSDSDTLSSTDTSESFGFDSDSVPDDSTELLEVDEISDDSLSDFVEPLESEDLVEDPGRTLYPLNALTTHDIHDHNRKYGKQAVWWKHSNAVYDVRRLYVLLSPSLRRKGQEFGMSASQYKHRVHNAIKRSFVPFQRVVCVAKRMKLCAPDLTAAMNKCKIGYMRSYTFHEQCADIITGVQRICDSLEEMKLESSQSEYIQEYLDSFQLLCREMKQQPGYATPVILYGDPNQHIFYLPPWFQATSLRTYLNDYTPLDTTIDVDPLQDTHEVLTTEECDVTFQSTLRPWLNTWQTFDTTVDDYAWKTAEVDVIKHDIVTDQQCELLKMRANRMCLCDKALMERRREELLSYFLARSFVEETAVENFRLWTVRMEESELKFQSLIDKN